LNRHPSRLDFKESIQESGMEIISSPLVQLSPDRTLVSAPVVALAQVRRMRGGSQAHLMRCSDENFYVVKFRNNPQHQRILVNEMLAGQLAKAIGLPVPELVVVEVGDYLVEHSSELTIQLPGSTIRCEAGLQFGSRYVVHPRKGETFDFLPIEMLDQVRNREAFAGILAMDKWTGNADRRQATFWRKARERKYTVTFIDQGYCFNAGEWTFPDYPLRGVYARNEVYAEVRGWESFEPWLSRIEDLSLSTISAVAEQIPPGWYGSDWSALDALVRSLLERRGLIRELVTAFRSSPRNPFPNWGMEEGTKSRVA
jgi:hypothetical protein